MAGFLPRQMSIRYRAQGGAEVLLLSRKKKNYLEALFEEYLTSLYKVFCGVLTRKTAETAADFFFLSMLTFRRKWFTFQYWALLKFDWAIS